MLITTASYAVPPSLSVQVLYGFFTQVVQSNSKHPLLQQARPVLKNVLRWLEASFGSAASFTPTTTHVLLVSPDEGALPVGNETARGKDKRAELAGHRAPALHRRTGAAAAGGAKMRNALVSQGDGGMAF